KRQIIGRGHRAVEAAGIEIPRWDQSVRSEEPIEPRRAEAQLEQKDQAVGGDQRPGGDRRVAQGYAVSDREHRSLAPPWRRQSVPRHRYQLCKVRAARADLNRYHRPSAEELMDVKFQF